MQVVNGTNLDMNATESIDKDGRAWLVVVVKGTYDIPADASAAPLLSATQRGLLYTDVFEGEVGLSAPLLENDLVPVKSMCDVIVKGSAHAPQGKPVTEVTASLAVGPIKKSIRVVGNRRWTKRGSRYEPSGPEPFVKLPISYSRASGAMFNHASINSNDPRDFLVHPENFVGCGYARGKFLRLIEGSPVPNLEWPNAPISDPEDLVRPASFGPLSRGWAPRASCAGTYDDKWRDEVFPLLPSDFDERYYQSAPADQQMPFPTGGEEVRLLNMQPGGGLTLFRLPDLHLGVLVLSRRRARTLLKTVVDTIVIDADSNTFDLVWRGRLPLAYGLSEIHTVVSGRVCKRWWESVLYGQPDCGCGGVETNDTDLVPVTEVLA